MEIMGSFLLSVSWSSVLPQGLAARFVRSPSPRKPFCVTDPVHVRDENETRLNAEF
jgi:hypothetical protein